jgi:hypothetical protein
MIPRDVLAHEGGDLLYGHIHVREPFDPDLPEFRVSAVNAEGDEAGVRAGDVVRRINGTPMRYLAADLWAPLYHARAGDRLTVEVWRLGTPPTGLELAGACRPALAVRGDYYDFVPLDGDRLGIAIGDISGKGIPAALLMATLRAFLRGRTDRGGGDLAGLIADLSGLVYESSAPNRYATFFYAEYDPATRRPVLHGVRCEPPAAIIERVMAAADTFVAGAPQHDDMTLVVVRCTS